MPDDRAKKGVPDRIRINPTEEYELRYWSKEWGVTQKQIKDTVQKVGPMVRNVKKELGIK